MEEAQTVNLDIAAATARFIQADAQARIAGAPLLPSLSGAGQETYSRTSGSSASGLSNGGREIVNYQASLSASYELDFWGKNRDAAQAAEETAVANRFDRDVVALTTLTSVANAYFQVLVFAGSPACRPAQHRQRPAHSRRDQAKARRRHRQRSRRCAAGERARQPARAGAAAAANARAEHQRTGDAGVASAGKHQGRRRLAEPDRDPAGDAGPAIRDPDAAAGHPAAGGAAGVRHREHRQCAGAILSEHPADRQGGYQSSALSRCSSRTRPSSAWSAVRPSRSSTAARSSAISNSPGPEQDELLQTYRKTVVQSFADVDNALTAVRETTIRLRLQARRGRHLAAGLPAGRRPVAGGNRRHCDCAKRANDTISGGRFAGAGAAGAAAGDRQPLSGAGGRLGAEDGKAGQCSLSRS